MVTYHPDVPNIGGILRELYPFLHYSERCKQRFVARRAYKTIWFAPNCELLFRILVGAEGLINVRVIDAMYVII